MRSVGICVVLGMVLGGCGDEKSGSKVSLFVRQAESDALSLFGAQRAQSLLAESDDAGRVSFQPDSYKLYISTIVLQGAGGLSNQFYTCSESEEACEVDFADDASVKAFEQKLKEKTIGAGVYDTVWISCSTEQTSEGATGAIKFSGSATLSDGTILYPTAGSNETYATSDKSQKAQASVTTYCGLTMPLARPLTVKDEEGATVDITMFSNLAAAGYYEPMGLGEATKPSGCTNRTQGVEKPSFCVGYPSVFPYFGLTEPTVEYYLVANHSSSSADLTIDDANVLVKIIKDETGTPFWASMGDYYIETSPSKYNEPVGVNTYANSVGTFEQNSDGSYKIKSLNYGFEAFKLESHSGEVLGEGLSGGAGTGQAVTYHYKAFKL